VALWVLGFVRASVRARTGACGSGISLIDITFDIDPFSKHFLVNGLNKIGITLVKEDLIVVFEKMRTGQCSWLDGASLTVPASIPMYPSAEFWKQDIKRNNQAA
jgi:hypothetical protein